MMSLDFNVAMRTGQDLEAVPVKYRSKFQCMAGPLLVRLRSDT